jgi:hypothetical protein
MQVPVSDSPNTTVEWIRENNNILGSISPGGSFPTAPGVYTFEVIAIPDVAKNIPGQVVVYPDLTVSGEPLIVFDYSAFGEAQLTHDNIYPNSIRLWLNDRKALIRDVDFLVDESTGLITFLKDQPEGAYITADYRYKMPELGPFDFKQEEFNVSILPGIVIAFGDRSQLYDKFAVVVTDERTEVANVYGGRFEVNFDLIAFSKDSEDREKLSDYVVMKILERQNTLGFEGLELINLSPGGENEDVYNPETDEYYYDSNISLGFRVDWFIYVPLPVVVSRAEMVSASEELSKGNLDGSAVVDLVQMDPIGRFSYNIGKPIGYERII